MKKIAIVGASNSFIQNGYGRIIKACAPNDVDIYSFGGNTSLLAVFQLLQFYIINNYKYVVFNYNMSETHHCYFNTYSKEYIVSFLLWIINQFKNKKSIPIFLLLPYLYVPRYESINYIYNVIANRYNIHLLDMDKELVKYNDDTLINYNDRTHFAPKFQKIIAKNLLKFIDKIEEKNSKFDIETENVIPNFSLFPDSCFNDLESEIKGTSWKKLKTYRIKLNHSFLIPDGYWLCGIFYWTNDGTAPYLSIKTRACHITKNLNLIPKNAFSARIIGYSCLGGDQAGIVSLVENRLDTIHEPTGTEDIECPKKMNDLFVVSMLLCDCNPWQYGNDFMLKYSREFMEAKKEMMEFCLKYIPNSCNL